MLTLCLTVISHSEFHLTGEKEEEQEAQEEEEKVSDRRSIMTAPFALLVSYVLTEVRVNTASSFSVVADFA